MRAILSILAALCLSTVAHADDEIGRGEIPSWVRSAPASIASPPPLGGDAIRFELVDQQFHLDETGWRTFVRTRTALYSTQAVTALGTIVIPWNPAFQDATVHSVEILRGDQRIDALAGRSFTTLRREQNLESAIIDGMLTATLQLNDLRVGDRIEWAFSTVTRIPVLGEHVEFAASAAIPALVENYSMRGSWPAEMDVRLKASDDWPTPRIARRGRQAEIEIHQQNFEPVAIPDDAPLRFHHVRWLEVSDYASWGELAAIFDPLYAQAAVLGAESPLHAEIDRIRSAHAAPADQALAALRLVQDDVRYLALALGEGGLVPASADETWARRLGDCKAKTVLLMALLRGLGIETHPALVSTAVATLDQHLPSVSAFDHVIVEARIEGETVWLDGTRIGDRTLTPLDPIRFGWVLPLRPAGAALVHIEDTPPETALRETAVAIDLTGGLYAPGPVTGSVLLRGDNATITQSQFSVATAAQRDAYMIAVWESLLDDVQVTQVGSTYDEARNELRMTMTGDLALNWTEMGSRRAEIPVSRIFWTAGDARAEGPFQTLPRTTNYPGFSRFRTTLTLPDGGEGFTVAATDIDQESAAYRFRRTVTRDGADVVMERETLSLRPEMTEPERLAAVDPLARLAGERAIIAAPASYYASADDLDALADEGGGTATELIGRGLALSQNRRPDEAIAAFDQAIQAEPGNANAYANRGIVLFWQGQHAEAAADFDKALELDPSESVAMTGRGLVALQQERALDAVVEFSLALRSAPKDPFILGMRSSAYAALEQWDRALEDVRAVKALLPGSPQPDMREIAILVEAGRLEQARTQADALAAAMPDDIEVRRVQAEVLATVGDAAAAEAAYSAGLEQEPDHPVLLIGRADMRLRQGDEEGARTDIVLVRSAAGQSPALLNNICWVQALAGFDLEQAMRDCDAAIALRPEEAGFLDSRGMVLLQLGRAAEAIEVYDRALSLAPTQAASLYGRGLAERALGNESRAQSDIASAIRLAPSVAKTFERYEAGHTVTVE